jgi:hypothetical protein
MIVSVRVYLHRQDSGGGGDEKFHGLVGLGSGVSQLSIGIAPHPSSELLSLGLCTCIQRFGFECQPMCRS